MMRLRGSVYGRMAVCSGSVPQTLDRQFAVLMDLENRRYFAEHTWPGRTSHPVMIGLYLFTVEAASAGDDPRDGTVRLARRRVHRRSSGPPLNGAN